MMEPDLVDLQQVQVLSIDQIRSIRAHNNYVDRPITSTTQSNPSISQQHQKIEWTQERQDLHRSQSHHHHPHHSHQTPSSTVSSVSWSSTASEQRLLAGLTPSHSGPVIIRIQPKGEIKPEDLVKGVVDSPDLSRHLFICELCGKCKCEECSTPRTLPSCWLCGQRCLCSLENAVEYGTCLCCVKGIFYHCSSDDEDNCADQPCSCSQGQACSRWTTMGLLSVFLPCLCCYLPAKGCLKLCQRSYDRAKRPGCRCSNTNTVCRKISSSSGPTPFPKTLQKPV
ncbi:protein sprouty homolog 3-like [Acipenser ruthenus]|nr:protein sprouty homolog 3-like [Acipenser ruthenus]